MARINLAMLFPCSFLCATENQGYLEPLENIRFPWISCYLYEHSILIPFRMTLPSSPPAWISFLNALIPMRIPVPQDWLEPVLCHSLAERIRTYFTFPPSHVRHILLDTKSTTNIIFQFCTTHPKLHATPSCSPSRISLHSHAFLKNLFYDKSLSIPCSLIKMQ